MDLPASSRPRRVAVIGGGIAGLAAAHRTCELDPAVEIVLFEASDRLGGAIHTVCRDGYLVETGADSFITNVPWAIDLCRRLGIDDELISTETGNRRALVVSRGQLYPVPEGFLLMAPERLWPLMHSPILSWRGKLRAAWEWFLRRQEVADESLASFARRRLGREVFERLVQPLVGGIYTADPEKLSLAATMPRFLEMERRHGGLIRGMRQARQAHSQGTETESGARYSMFVTPRNGMSSLIEAIAARLPRGSVRFRAPVKRLERNAAGWRVDDEAFDAVIIATPAHVVARLLEPLDATLASELGQIEYANSAVVALGYERAQIKHPLDGFGFVVPAIEHRRILSASFSSVKFAGRAPQGKVLMRVFLGGALQGEILERSDGDLVEAAVEELGALLGITGRPVLSEVFRWSQAMPQYHLGHGERVQQIQSRFVELPGLALAGNAFSGVGVPHCIRSGEAAAEQALSAKAACHSPT